MADEPEVQPDTVPDQPDQNAQPQAGSENAPPKLLFGKYKDEAEAERGYKDLEHKLSEQGEQLGMLRRELGSFQERSQMSEALAKITELVAKSKEPTVDYAQLEEDIAATMADNPAEATKKLLRAVGSWTANDRQTLLGEIKSFKEELVKMRGELTEKLETADSFYSQNKETIDKLVKGGMRLSAAKDFVREIVKDDGSNSATRRPVSVSPSSTSSASKAGNSYLSAKEREQMKAEGFTDDDINEMEATQKRNIARMEREAREKAGE